jgi:hypothetical protein
VRSTESRLHPDSQLKEHVCPPESRKIVQRIRSRTPLAFDAARALQFEPWSILRGKSHHIRVLFQTRTARDFGRRKGTEAVGGVEAKRGSSRAECGRGMRQLTIK